MGTKEPALQDQSGLEPKRASDAEESNDKKTKLNVQDYKGIEPLVFSVVADEVLRDRIRGIVNEKPKVSRFQSISHNPLASVVIGFLLSGLLGASLTIYYSQKQQELAARRSFSDELNKIRIQKFGEVWERIDEDELAIDSLLEETSEETSKDSDSKDRKVDEIRKLIHADRAIVSKNRFWLGEGTYEKARGYLDKSVHYALNHLMASRGTDVSELKRQREDAKQNILEIRSLFLEGESSPQPIPK
jgi:hypothetical protein